MVRKLMIMLASGLICLLGIIPALALTQYSTLEEYEKVTGKKMEGFREAPMLRAQVAAGKIPPIEKRLPDEPAVIEPEEEIGQYGGTWHRVAISALDTHLWRVLGGTKLIAWTADAKNVQPNIAKKWEISEDGRTFTFYLRKGIKWSSGAPFTADDIMFWYEDIILNDALTPGGKPGWLTLGGEVVVVEKVDAYTVKFRFALPYGFFLQQLAFLGEVAFPKHYLKQFHPRYVSKEKLEDLTKEAGFEEWYELFLSKNETSTNPDLPVINPWKLTVGPPATRMVAERNPYYWKIDSSGNQLPYIDRITFDLVENAEIANFKALAGEIDMQRNLMSTSNYTLFMDGREKGDYRVLGWNVPSNAVALMPNHSHKDPVMRELIQNLEFRIALSHAINREEISELVYVDIAVPRAGTVVPQSPYYQEDLEKLYAEYDPEKANKLLDEIGLAQRDKEGYRLRPDGKRLSFLFEVPQFVPEWPDVAELVTEYWEVIGIKVTLKTIARSLYSMRTAANEMDVTLWAQPAYLLINAWAYNCSVTNWAPLYAKWYQSDGEQGEEPPEYILQNMKLYDQLQITTDPEESLRIGKQIIRNHVENLYQIGTVGSPPAVIIVKNNFRNVPEKGISAWTLWSINYTRPEQYFIKQK